MIYFVLEGDIDRKTKALVKHICQQRFEGNVIVNPGEASFSFEIGPDSLSSIGALIIACISLCLQIKDDHLNRANYKTLTASDFRRLLETELLGMGIVNFDLIKVSGFTGLSKSNEGACKFLIRDESTNDIVTLYVLRDGNDYTIRRKVNRNSK